MKISSRLSMSSKILDLHDVTVCVVESVGLLLVDMRLRGEEFRSVGERCGLLLVNECL